MVKVAVAGGFGFLGSNIVKVLKKKNYEVVPFSRRSGIDIRDWKTLISFLKNVEPEIVINSAAHVGGIAYNALKPVEIYEDNLMMGFNLLRASFEVGVKKFVNIMPNCTYPGVAEIYREDKWWDGPMHETVLTYGMPRKALWVHAWALKEKYGFNSIHLVLPNLYGPGDHFDPIRSHALGALIKKIVDAKFEGKKIVEIWGTGNPVREWGYVEDAAEGIVLAMEMYNDVEIMNIGEGKGYTIREIAYMIKDAANWDGEFIFDRSKPDGAPKKILDIRKMKRILGWQPKTNIREGIKKTVEWYIKKTWKQSLK
ncbi:Nucleoside-diphosphate-sugar epimerase [Archaeoglobus sulfaticallidus PM70-1]|uniref:GDP-L-fucose synthase n=1 Tax=Archaeoglobus sulfaticallidus PM70-1 TaxID=387631 RepID=N0BAQ6_9EURY|nr:NAD-dependent epimerase/dehydratase family protein [Archaeoglobus sulfaticallidus]AGK60073.1 Nucleoside-diphosphate-sugar epimerase [Archaeoglobus sulfaticallidus PM70-1]